ncbi:CapA family protein [Nocardia niigatensis]|uniref:CapA family protein n=1 Tax=Nocardia niigatensis TaxID=209249 RepID=UPI000300B606|nr:CapA family protein [Nocardia niigatensis]
MSSEPSQQIPITVLLGGDVMLGRGVDQILPHPGDPQLHERWIHDARAYVELAEKANGPIRYPVDFGWPWGDAGPVLDQLAPEVRLINLETSITLDGEYAPGKGIHYRMNPANLATLQAFRPDICALANNHILDFGVHGLHETLAALAAAGIRTAGAGTDIAAACRPVALEPATGRRVVIVSVASTSSGVPRAWAAQDQRPGVWLIGDPPGHGAADHIAGQALAHKRSGDVLIVSVHWGSNWGYGVGLSEIQFAHRLVDAGVDIVHGHSSHHPRPIEIYHGRPILYGCGDVIDDYEGISGYESYRPELRLLYLVSIELGGQPTGIRMLPLRVRHMRLEHAPRADADWLGETLTRISHRFHTHVERGTDDLLRIRWE